MSVVLVVTNSTPTTCPHCGGALSMPLGSRSRPGMVLQTCKNYQPCGRALWSAASAVVTAPIVDDGSRHGRFQLPVTSEPEPAPINSKANWSSVARMARRELVAINSQDRKIAAAGGDR